MSGLNYMFLLVYLCALILFLQITFRDDDDPCKFQKLFCRNPCMYLLSQRDLQLLRVIGGFKVEASQLACHFASHSCGVMSKKKYTG
jgi:hypothetical protein